MADFSYRIRVSPDVIFQEVLLGESILMDTRTLAYFAFDELGTRIWRVIERGADADEAYNTLLASYGDSEADFEMKFNNIINGLAKSRIITLESQGT